MTSNLATQANALFAKKAAACLAMLNFDTYRHHGACFPRNVALNLVEGLAAAGHGRADDSTSRYDALWPSVRFLKLVP